MVFTSWRGTAGMVLPTMRPGLTEDVIRLLPDGVGMLPLYLDIRRGEMDEFESAHAAYEEKIAVLAQAGAAVVHPAGAPPFMLLGPERERDLLAGWERKYGIQLFTAGTNHVRAFRALSVRRIVGASYSALQNRIVVDYLTAAGIEVLAMAPLEVPFEDVGTISGDALYAHIKRLALANPGADGLYIQGSGWRTIGIIERLERDLGLPVVHAVTAKVWEFQKRLTIREPRRGYGVLLTELP